MDNLIVELNELKRIVISALSRPRNIGLAVCGLGASCFLYFTLKIYLERRKYRNIPGPPTRGFVKAQNLQFFVYISFYFMMGFKESSDFTWVIYRRFRKESTKV